MRHYSEKNHGTYTRVDKRGRADLPKSSTHKVGGYIVHIEAYDDDMHLVRPLKGYLIRLKWEHGPSYDNDVISSGTVYKQNVPCLLMGWRTIYYINNLR